jgi:hypothetical protein
LAAALATATGGVVAAAAPAFADGADATTMTVTPSHSTQVSGQPVTFSSQVVAATPSTAKFTGTVTWTVTGLDGTVVPCTSVKPLTGGGRSVCKIAKGVLLGGDSPYTATAAYGGDATYGLSSGFGALTVTAALTNVKLVISAPPTNGAATVATATVVGGPATALLGGSVVFTVTSGLHTTSVVVGCTGTATGKNSVLANDTVTLTGQVAVCNLPAGWMILPKASAANPHPTDNWAVSAMYTGNGSFVLGRRTKSGTDKF